jgi:peptidyl-prolyl cis-trans isomerase SurA
MPAQSPPRPARSNRLLAASLAAAAALLLAAPPARAEVSNRIIARVNDRIATLYDYEVRFEDAVRRSRDVPEDPTDRGQYLDQLARDVMKEVFEELLIMSRADQLAITVTEQEVTESIDRMREANGLEDEQQFREALAQSGMTPDLLRTQFEQQMRFQRVIGREVYSEIQLGEEDLRRYYKDHLEEFRQPEQIELREVVVLDDTGSSPSAASVAAGLALELSAGKPLEEAIADVGADVVSPVIELGWVEAGDLDPALRDAVWTLPAGEWSKATRGRGGVHVAQVIDRKESVIPSFKDVEAEIRTREERARLNVRMKEYLVELEKKSYLYLDPPPQAAGFRSSSGEAPGGTEFTLIAPADDAAGAGEAKDGEATVGADAAGDEDAAEAAEEGEIERDLEELEEETPPEDAPAPDAPPGS